MILFMFISGLLLACDLSCYVTQTMWSCVFWVAIKKVDDEVNALSVLNPHLRDRDSNAWAP